MTNIPTPSPRSKSDNIRRSIISPQKTSSHSSPSRLRTPSDVVGATPGTQRNEIAAEIQSIKAAGLVVPKRREVERRESEAGRSRCCSLAEGNDNGEELGKFNTAEKERRGSDGRRGSRKANIEDLPSATSSVSSSSLSSPHPNAVLINDVDSLSPSSFTSADEERIAIMDKLGLKGDFPNLYTTKLHRVPPSPSGSDASDDDGDDEWDKSLGVHFYIPQPRVEGSDLADDVLSGMGMGMGGVMGYGIKNAGDRRRTGKAVGTMLIVRRVTCLEDGRSSPAQRSGMLQVGDVVVEIGRAHV